MTTVLALKLEEIIARKANARMLAGIKIEADPTQKSAEGIKGETRDELAKVARVSHDTIAKVKPGQCPRCGGNLVADWDPSRSGRYVTYFCLQCGFSPELPIILEDNFSPQSGQVSRSRRKPYNRRYRSGQEIEAIV